VKITTPRLFVELFEEIDDSMNAEGIPNGKEFRHPPEDVRPNNQKIDICLTELIKSISEHPAAKSSTGVSLPRHDETESRSTNNRAAFSLWSKRLRRQEVVQ
jgi:hypothetical protein